jgi:cytoskeleton protein RodZ
VPIDDAPISGEPTLGSALRAAREAAGRTVEQVSSHTKIRSTLIRDLEADDLSSSGGAVYARGHVKAIASALGVDLPPLLALFDKAAGQPVPVAVVAREPDEPVVTSFGGSAFAASAAASLTRERTGPRWGLALAGAAAVLVGIIVVGAVNSPGAKVPTTSLGAGPTSTPTASTPAVVHTPNPEAVASKPPVTGAQLRLRLIGGNSWVSVRNAQSTLFEGLLRDGEFKDFTDPTRLKVTVGNALAVNLNCGGRDSGPAGGSGKVGHFTCTAAGLTAT